MEVSAVYVHSIISRHGWDVWLGTNSAVPDEYQILTHPLGRKFSSSSTLLPSAISRLRRKIWEV